MNAPHAIQCPPASMLSDFGLGKLDAAKAETVSQHLETCADCRERVARLSGDSFVNRLRGVPDGAAPDRIEHTFVGGDSASNAAHSSETPYGKRPEDGLPRRSVNEQQPRDGLGSSSSKNDGLGSPSSAPSELANHPDYELLKELGRGGMGVVYLARNRMMDRMEVLKVVSKSLLDKPGALERFQQEIRSAAKLLHPNIVAAHAVLRPGDLLVFAMEYVPGQDLMQVVKKRGYLPIANATFYAHQVAMGLQHAHEAGMVHRDIKPNNLMLAIVGKKHIVKILDFGLAKATSEKAAETALTKSGQMLGTPDYIAPEQTLDAHQADIRADIYSLGCTLYYFLAGRPPFQESSLFALLDAHQRRDAQPLNLVRPDVPVELAAVVAKMLAKDPAKRYQTPLEVVKALTPFFKPGQAPAATAATPSTGLPPQATAETAASAVSPTETWLPAQRSAVPSAAPSPVPAVPIPLRAAAADLEPSISIDTHRAAAPRRNWWRSLPPWQRLAILSGAAAALLLTAIVLSIQTPHGTVEIALSDPKAKVTITVDSDKIDIGNLDEPLSLQAGDHDLKVTGKGYETITKKFTVTKGKNAPLVITLQPTISPDADKRPSAQQQHARIEGPRANNDHAVAEWVLAQGGTVYVVGGNWTDRIAKADLLPPGDWTLKGKIDLSNTKVADSDIERLSDLHELRVLSLEITNIGDDALAYLKRLTNLNQLYLYGTRVTQDGVASLQAALPNCKIFGVPVRPPAATATAKDDESDAGKPIVKPNGEIIAAKRLAAGYRSAWLPDGKQILVTAVDGGIDRVDADSGMVTHLTTFGFDPAASPAGKLIAYVRCGLGGHVNDGLFLNDTDGRNMGGLLAGGWPSWSSDGKTVYFHSRSDWLVKALDVTTPQSAPRDVVLVKESLYPTVSPDGKNVAYVADGSLAVINLETNSRLTRPLPRAQHGYVGWSPDSKRLAYSGAGALDNLVHGSGLAGELRRQHELASRGDDVGLWLFDLASGTTKEITAGPYTMPAWSPDGKWLSFDLRAPGRYEVFALETAELDTPQPLPQETKKGHEREVAEWVLSKGGKVRIEGVVDEIADRGKLPHSAIRLKGINLRRTNLADKDLTRIKDLPNLDNLRLDLTPLGDAGLQELSGLPNLASLDVGYTKVTNAGMQYVARCKRLKGLDVRNTTVGDEGLRQLEDLPLESLGLWNTPITGKCLRYLKKMPLHSLFMKNSLINDADLPALSDIPALRWLGLEIMPITDAGLEHLKGLKDLEILQLQNTKTTQQGIESLRAALPKCKISWP